MLRCLGWLAVVAASMAATPLAAQPAAQWTGVADGSNLTRPAYWEAFPGATARGDGQVSIAGADDSTPVVDRYGPRLDASGDFRVVASLHVANDSLASLVLVDAVPADAWGPAMRRVEVGMAGGQVVVGVFDGSGRAPTSWQTFDASASHGPVTLGVARIDGSIVVDVSGAEVTRLTDPGIFQTGRVLLGTRVAAGNQLDLYALDVQAPADRAAAVSIERCAPPRLLAAGQDDSNVHTGIWWVWPDDDIVRQVEASENQRSVLVAVSPDSRWVTYYQRSNQAPPDHFLADTWVMNLANDERYKLVDGNAPLGWMADSAAVVLGERPYLMALVPGGELVPTAGKPALVDSLRSAPSPDHQWRAGVATSSRGAEGVELVDVSSNDVVMSIPTGRGAVELAWSPDSTRLAFTSSDATAGGLAWRLRVVDVAARSVSLVDATRDMDLHSVVWARALPGCQPAE